MSSSIFQTKYLQILHGVSAAFLENWAHSIGKHFPNEIQKLYWLNKLKKIPDVDYNSTHSTEFAKKGLREPEN